MKPSNTSFLRITESTSPHRHLEQRSVAELLRLINEEDQGVPAAVAKAIPQITAFVEAAAEKMLAGGRLFYIGAGTSGRLGILDASECPPTYGVPAGLVVGIIAGGEQAIQNAVEGAEDDNAQGWKDLEAHHVSDLDVVFGIAASGTTPYVIGALEACRERGIVTGSLCCNPGAPLSAAARFPVEVVVGPEVVTGSTRMKSGTAQKLVLNMISTTIMIRMGRVEDNKMVNMKLANKKLVDRGVQMLMERSGIADYGEARDILLQHGSVKKALEHLAGR
ncbi:N-acetylmuramic acid 6-phosphate etherase [Flaviaesturariibacter flavus]|uniref:N-acetylmuramic acid 6-phosphate etherase n=1 Tax=Flaviaesturariibacter flavus TaxID=2502780 RepID=A0A4R1BJT9_9BACT|nr:N-acetylmuramic acid 6-phosphate etherase [Flaviaesturariibacter flavus]TCJ17517.1 N-acetylmuramic acid 6-phosphate etherase [Flaviaesturariibacter flavus]